MTFLECLFLYTLGRSNLEIEIEIEFEVETIGFLMTIYSAK